MQKACLPSSSPRADRPDDERDERADRPTVKIQGAAREKHAVTVTHVVSVLIVGARNVLSDTRRMMQNFLAFRESPIIP